MTNLFKNASQRLVHSPFVIVITLVFSILLVISLGLLYESFQTTVRGYQLLPTAKVNDWVIPLVGLLPLVGQIAFTYAFAADTRKRWAILIAFMLHLFDMLTDVYYKAHGQGLLVWVVALIESEVLFTLGAVAAFTFSFGMLIELLPHAIEQAIDMLHRLTGALGLHGEDDEQPQTRRSASGRDLD